MRKGDGVGKRRERWEERGINCGRGIGKIACCEPTCSLSEVIFIKLKLLIPPYCATTLNS